VLTLSANGTIIGTGIVWSSMVASGDGDHGVHHGVLRALDAETLKQLWSSDINRQRDNAGDWPKFSPPLVVNGRVYLASFPVNGVSRSIVNVYGLLPH
jgi:outer membrane protein assembly factor BamB